MKKVLTNKSKGAIIITDRKKEGWGKNDKQKGSRIIKRKKRRRC